MSLAVRPARSPSGRRGTGPPSNNRREPVLRQVRRPWIPPAIVTELATLSPEFRRIWGIGEAVMCAAGRRRLRHPAAGLLTLDCEPLHVPAALRETGLVVHVFRAEEGSAEADALAGLA
ncbi:hypothetical protein [Streptomyces sp. NPDC088360]|uniref:MmyB family transcriptional regulator n=1 Tax=Streptomyces sp. NPDC088360 TaxID=3154515 RepID=UPI003450883F